MQGAQRVFFAEPVFGVAGRTAGATNFIQRDIHRVMNVHVRLALQLVARTMSNHSFYSTIKLTKFLIAFFAVPEFYVKILPVLFLGRSATLEALIKRV